MTIRVMFLYSVFFTLFLLLLSIKFHNIYVLIFAAFRISVHWNTEKF